MTLCYYYYINTGHNFQSQCRKATLVYNKILFRRNF